MHIHFHDREQFEDLMHRRPALFSFSGVEKTSELTIDH